LQFSKSLATPKWRFSFYALLFCFSFYVLLFGVVLTGLLFKDSFWALVIDASSRSRRLINLLFLFVLSNEGMEFESDWEFCCGCSFGCCLG